MKVTYLCHIYPWITQTFVFNEMRHWRQHGVDLTVVAFKKPNREYRSKLSEEMRSAIETTFYFPHALSWQSLRSQIKFFFTDPIRYVSTFFKTLFGEYVRRSSLKLRLHSIQDFLRGVLIADFLRSNGFDHVHAEFPNHSATSAWIAHRLIDLPFSFRSHTSKNPQLISEKIKSSKFVLCGSQFDRDRILGWLNGDLADKLIVDYLGIELGEPKRIERSENLILCVGSLIAKKGQSHLIEACHILQNRKISFRLVIVGDGEDREKLESQISRYDLKRVEITGYLPYHEVSKRIGECAIFCLPCVVTDEGDSDGIPTVLIEAIEKGKPCVSTAVAGIPELIIDQKTGLIAEQKDPKSLADALEKLLIDPDLRESLGNFGRDHVHKNFNIVENTRRTAKFFNCQ